MRFPDKQAYGPHVPSDVRLSCYSRSRCRTIQPSIRLGFVCAAGQRGRIGFYAPLSPGDEYARWPALNRSAGVLTVARNSSFRASHSRNYFRFRCQLIGYEPVDIVFGVKFRVKVFLVFRENHMQVVPFSLDA